jgi:hypothetical protein
MTDKDAERALRSRAEKESAANKRSDDVFAEEARRVASDVAKTAKLRGLRETRDAAEREAAEAQAKRVARAKQRAKPKRAKGARGRQRK